MQRPKKGALILNKHTHSKLFFIWSIVGLVYGLEFFIRICPNALQATLQETLAINYTQLGKLSAIFYYSYALCQIPCTLLLTRYDLKKVLLSFLLIFYVGLVLFARSFSFEEALIARALLGIGSSITFTLLLELAQTWFDPKNFSFYVGLVNAFGVLGALCAEYPLEIFLTTHSWRSIITQCAHITLFLSLILLVITPSYRQHSSQKMSLQESFLSNKVLISKLIFIGFAMVLPIIVLPELWGLLVMTRLHHLSATEAAWVLSFFFIGTGIGSLLKALLSLKISNTRLIKIFLFIEFSGLILLIINPLHSSFFLACCCFTIGVSAAFMLLIFSIVQQQLKESSLTIAIINVGIMVSSVCAQPIIGWYLDASPELALPLNFSLKIAMSFLPLILIPAYTVTNSLKLEDNLYGHR
jgi:predicted MFS family arabinose efflux permease